MGLGANTLATLYFVDSGKTKGKQNVYWDIYIKNM